MVGEVIETDERGREDFSLDQSLIPTVRRALAEGDRARLEALLGPLHPADIADLLEQVDSTDRRGILSLGGG